MMLKFAAHKNVVGMAKRILVEISIVNPWTTILFKERGLYSHGATCGVWLSALSDPPERTWA